MRPSALHLVLFLVLAACGDDGGTDQQVDAAPPVDARILTDAARQACSPGMDSCELEAYERVCDVGRSLCVECLVPADCAGNEALGPQCQESDNTCRCSAHDDCQSNIGGGYCHPIASACGCLSIDDCPANSECEIEPYLGTGIRRCRPI